jgi:pyrimidine-specific ribonucleoside hydrolase
MQKIPILMDVDTGVDDAMAILLACSAKEQLDLLGITAVAGNQTVEKTSRNTQKILELVGRTDVPVAKGAAKPLCHALRTAAEVHGPEGLGNVTLPDPLFALSPLDAVSLQKKLLEESREKVTLVPTGPLTNIALLLRTWPDIKKKIKEIVLMGGGAFRGNNSVLAEFNILVDPEAAKIVFSSGIPIVMCGLDITMQAILLNRDIGRFEKIDTPVGHFVSRELRYYAGVYQKLHALEEGAAVHDAVAVAYLIAPEIMRGKMAKVEIDTTDGPCLGATVADFRDAGIDYPEANAKVMTDIDREAFAGLLYTHYAEMTGEVR